MTVINGFEIDFNKKNELFHKLWTKAVGKEDYDKSEWKELDRFLLLFDVCCKEVDELNIRIKELEEEVDEKQGLLDLQI